MSLHKIIAVSILTGLFAVAQTAPAPARKPAAPAAAASPVDTVIQLVKGGMSESLIIKTLQRQNKPANLSTEDMLKLQKAGVSDNIIGVMLDSGAQPAGGVRAAVAAPPTVAAVAPVAAPPAAAAVDCPTPAAVSAVSGAAKRRLAVEAFDYSAVRTQVSGMFGNDVNIGQGIRAMLTVKMGQSKNVVLLEREKLNTVLKEQDFGATNRVKQGTKAKIGGITGADAMLFGDIVIFGRDDTKKRNGAGAVARAIPGFGGIGGRIADSKTTDKAVVAINLRLVDAESGEVLETAEARGESTRTSTDWGAVAGSWRGAAAASSSMTSSNFASTIIGEATQDAVDKIAAILEQRVPAIAAKSRTIEGRVATIDGCTIYLSVGGNDGVHVGDHFEIHQIIKEVLDPDTKEVLDKQTVKVGDFIAGTVRDKVTIGQYGGQPLSPSYAKGYAARMVAP
ncbi:MAG TPA: CsgG/HfaB family protein [Bryobacteraceae bacterium]|nr:CsgG/HfaB family protein [Bryobacteraceae bacterium]